MTRRAILTWLFLLATLQWHCIQSYVSPYHSPANGYLVVEGYITGNGPTSFRLTRSIALPGDSTIPAVTGAHVQVEGSDNTVYPFTETGNGFYVLPGISMNAAVRYRLRISNVNQEEYLSDYVPFKPTPALDSTVWALDTAGVNIYTYTHDPTGNTRYYQWKYNETWELTSWERSISVYQGDTLALRTPAQQIYTCWHTDSSSAILLGTSEQLAQDVINRKPIVVIPWNTEQLGIEYSVQVSQYALTDSGYNYLTLMKSNSEQLGSVMDPLPSQLTGNIHCLSHPGEMVIGFISAGTLQQQRIFIQRSQVPGWLYYFACPFPDITVAPDDYYLYFVRLYYTPIGPEALGSNDGAWANYNDCIDCRARDGASNQQPAFWQ